MNRTWRILTITLGLALTAMPQLRAGDTPAAPAVEKTSCSTGTCGNQGHDIWGWLTYCPKGRQGCTECGCLSRHGQRTPPLFTFFLEHPCPEGGEPLATNGKASHGHLHFVKHACTNCEGKATTTVEEMKVVPADAKKMPAVDAKKMPSADAK
jgi:hypothetical protein